MESCWSCEREKTEAVLPIQITASGLSRRFKDARNYHHPKDSDPTTE